MTTRSGVPRGMVLLAWPWALACVPHIDDPKPKQRSYQETFTASPAATTAAPGSLYTDAAPLASPLADLRARRPGDLVTVLIDEQALAERDAETKLTRDAAEDHRLQAMFGALAVLRRAVPDVNLDPALQANASSSFESGGNTSRRESVQATIPCTVRQVLGSGNLFIEGHRVILVNHDEHHLYLSGVVRPEDIDTANTVLSTRIVDAEIEMSGQGALAEKQRPGWFGRVMSWIWPF